MMASRILLIVLISVIVVNVECELKKYSSKSDPMAALVAAPDSKIKRVERSASAAALLAARAAISVGMRVLNNLSKNTYGNVAMWCIWNDWKARDQRARIEKTYNRGRFSHAKRTLGWVNGRYYCCFTQIGLQSKGWRLDG